MKPELTFGRTAGPCSELSDAEHTLPDRAAENLGEDDEVERDGSEHGEGRRAVQLESAVRQVAGQVADCKSGNEENEEEIERGGADFARLPIRLTIRHGRA